MYRYIKSAQATASLAKKLSAGWKQAYTQDVKNYRYEDSLLRKLHELEHKFEDEFKQLLDEVIDPNIATTRILMTEQHKSEVSVRVLFRYKHENSEYSFDWHMPNNTFDFKDYFNRDVKNNPLYKELEQALMGLTRDKRMKNIQEKYTEDLLEAHEVWQEAFTISNNLLSYEFFVENIIGSELFIPQSEGVYYGPLKVAKREHTIICEKCYYDNGGLVAKKVNKGYDTLVKYASDTFTLLTERQVLNIEKSYTL